MTTEMITERQPETATEIVDSPALEAQTTEEPATERQPETEAGNQEARQTADDDDRAAFDAELRGLFDRMWALEELCQDTESRVQDLSEGLKAAKKRLEDRTSQMRELVRAFHDMRRGSQNDAKRPLLSPPGEAATATVETPPNENWRTIPTDVLLDPPIEGFGAKKRTALLEAVPTLGDFVDLQCRVGKDAATLRELLPKGIGEQAADALEERLITAVRDYRISDEPADVGDSPQVAEAVADSPNSSAWPADVEEALQNEAVELYEIGKADRAEFDLLGDAHDSNEVAEGVEAYDDDQQVEECPYTFGSDQQKAWVYGWVSKYLDDPNQAIEVDETADKAEAIAALLEESASEPEPEPESAKPPVKSAVLTAQQILDDL